jgi:hypothetical protein
MADQGNNPKYPGHDEATVAPPKPLAGYNSPATHAPISENPVSVNVKTPSGETGGEKR